MRLSLVSFGCLLLAASGCAGERLYLAGGGETLYAVDLESGETAWEVPVADHSGGAGVAVSADGATVFVADGEVADEFRLRALEAASGEELAAYPLPDRLQERGGGNPLALVAGGRWLLAATYDYGAAASGVRVFDVEKGEYLQIGLRERACAAPDLAAAPGGAILAGCPGVLQQLAPLDPVPGEWREAARVSLDFGVVGALGADEAGVAYALSLAEPGRPLRLTRWNPGERDTQSVNLESGVGEMRRAALAVAPDGKRIAVAVDDALVLLDGELDVVARHQLPWEVEPRATFSPGGQGLYLLRLQPGGEDVADAVLLELDRNGGVRRELLLDGVRLPGPVSAFVASESP